MWGLGLAWSLKLVLPYYENAATLMNQSCQKIIYVDNKFKTQLVLFRVGGCSRPAALQHNRTAWLRVFWCGFECVAGGRWPRNSQPQVFGLPTMLVVCYRHVDLTTHTNTTVATCFSQGDLRVRSQKRNHLSQLTPYVVALSSKEEKFAGGRFKTSDFIFLPVLNKQRHVCSAPGNRCSRALWQHWSNESRYRYTFCHQKFPVREPFFPSNKCATLSTHTHMRHTREHIDAFFLPNIW